MSDLKGLGKTKRAHGCRVWYRKMLNLVTIITNGMWWRENEYRSGNISYSWRSQNPALPRAGRGRAARSGAAGRSGAGQEGCRRVGLPRRQQSHLLSRISKAPQTAVLNVFSEARTSEILCKPVEEHNECLTRGLSAGRRPLFVLGC